jgi:hypothetical protein
MIKECEVLPGSLSNRRTTSAGADVDEFIASGMKICEIEIPEGCKIKTAYGRYKHHIFRVTTEYGKCPVRLCKRGNRLFLVKTDEG